MSWGYVLLLTLECIPIILDAVWSVIVRANLLDPLKLVCAPRLDNDSSVFPARFSVGAQEASFPSFLSLTCIKIVIC